MNRLISTIYWLLLFLFTQTVSARSDVVNIFCWTGYMPNKIIEQFQNETKIKVNLTEFDSNETLYAKLKTAPYAGYDIIVPSSYFVDRMRKQDMLHKLDKTKLSNLKNLNPTLLNKVFDPNNEYSVPYMWGSTGIVVNKTFINPETVKGWKDLWNPRYKNQLLILDDMREVFGAALITLNYSLNDTNPEHVQQAYLKLKTLMPNIKIFNSDAIQNIYIDEDIIIGMGWSGDIRVAQEENPNLVYIYPQEGFAIWVDCLAIAKNAPHIDAAHKFINFVMRPDIAAEISIINHYPSPNLAATKLLPKSMQDDPILNPPIQTLKRGVFQEDISKSTELYTKYWELLKTEE